MRKTIDNPQIICYTINKIKTGTLFKNRFPEVETIDTGVPACSTLLLNVQELVEEAKPMENKEESTSRRFRQPQLSDVVSL